METKKHPYELLIRWDQSGNLAGAHVQYRYVVKDGNSVVAESLSEAESLAIGGFPLSEVLTTAQASALAEMERARNELFRVIDERNDAMTRLNNLLAKNNG